MRTYECKVLLNGRLIPVRVQASNPAEARLVVEALYGQPVRGTPQDVG